MTVCQLIGEYENGEDPFLRTLKGDLRQVLEDAAGIKVKLIENN